MRPIYGCTEKFWECSLRTRLLFPEICNGILFRSILRMCVQNLKFAALPVPEIIGVLQKFGHSLDTPTLHFLPKVKGFLFGWTLWMYLPNLKFVALPVVEIIGGTQKIWAVPVYAHAPFSPEFLTFLRMDPLNISAKFDVRSFTHPSDNRGTSKIWGVPGFAPLPILPNF